MVDSGCTSNSWTTVSLCAEKNAMCTETAYSYIATKGACTASSWIVWIAQGSVTGHKDVYTDSVQILRSTMAQQPVPVAIEGDQSWF